jgi:hypothetical protein
MVMQAPNLQVIPPYIVGPDQERQEWTRMCRRILYGTWKPDLEQRIAEQIPHVTRAAWGTVDLSANMYRSIWDALSTTYIRPPIISEVGEEFAELLATAGLWPLMCRVQRDTLGLREMLLRVNVADDKLVYRPVYPDMVEIDADPDHPDEPIEVREARLRTVDGKLAWTVDRLSIKDGVGHYQILDKDGQDISPQHLRDSKGERAPEKGFFAEKYPYLDKNNKPVLPYSLYHAARTATVWDAWATRELVEGTLNIGVYYTHLSHVIRSAAWRQRYMIDLLVAGAEQTGEGKAARSSVAADPSTVIVLQSDPDGNGQSSVGQWDRPADPREMIETISQYEKRLVSSAGINPADQMRMSGDPRSGYAVSVSRDAQREAQRKYEPQFRRGDLQTLRISAVLLNRATGSDYPETGHKIAYRGVPQSPAERDAHRKHILELLAGGLIDRVSAYRELHPGTTEEQARAAIEDISNTNRRTA